MAGPVPAQGGAPFPRAFLVLLAGVVVNRAATFIIPFLSFVLREHYRFTDTEAGATLLAYGAGSVASLLLGGVLTDRIGRRASMLLSLLGGGGLACALPFSGTGAGFVGLLCLYGFVGTLFQPAVGATVADLLPPGRRAAGYAALRTAVNVGWGVGLAVGGTLQEYGPRVTFVADGATTILFGLIVLAGVPESRPAAGAPAPAGPADLFRILRADGVLRTAALCTCAWSLLIISLVTVFALTVTEGAGRGPEAFGYVMGLNGLLVAGCQIPVIEAVAGRRRLRVAAAGMALGGISLAVLPLVPAPWWWALAIAAFTLGEMLALPQIQSFVSDLAPPAERGIYLGIQQAPFSVVLAVAQVALLPLRRAVGDGAYWPLLLLGALPAAATLLRLDRTADRPGRLPGAGSGGSGAEGGT